MSSRVVLSMKTQVNNLKISSFPKIPSLISIPTKQPHSKADNSRIYRYRNAVSLQIFTRNIKKEKVALSISRNKQIVNKYSYEHLNKEERGE